MTYRELLEHLQAQGYELISNGGVTETIEQHLVDLQSGAGDPDNVIYGESENPDNPCLLVYILPDQDHPVCQVYRTSDYAHHLAVQDLDADAELDRLGLLLTSTKAAERYGVHRDTTRRAAAAGLVEGAHQSPRLGAINPPWVATETAWQEWAAKRPPVGRPRLHPK